jgi:hypothetical protein
VSRLYLLPLWLVALFCIVSCDRPSHETKTISVWHFWSEPHQAKALRVLADAFEAQHPLIRVELVPLQWSDGKAKLKLALASNHPPDVVHIGLDWFADFAQFNVFEASPIPASVAWGEALSYADTIRAAPWFANCRALFVRQESSSGTIGFCTSDPHNVLKRMLPIIWRTSPTSFCTSLPIHQSIDEDCIIALDRVRLSVQQGARLARSRDLDELFLRGDIDTVVSGLWLMARLRDAPFPCRIIPVRSIVNADVLAVPRGGSSREAHSFVAFATSAQQCLSFCRAVPEAGFPMEDSTATQLLDSYTDTNARTKLEGFLATLRKSAPLPYTRQMLAIEEELEQMIDRCLYASSQTEVRLIVNASRNRVAALE